MAEKSLIEPLLHQQQRRSNRTLFLCFCLFVVLLFVNFFSGTHHISLEEIVRAAATLLTSTKIAHGINTTILFDLRLPRLLSAAFCGACLACAGTVSQGLFRNDLASPSVLGTTAASCLAIVGLYFFFAEYLTQNLYLVPLAAFLGAFLITLIISFFIIKGRRLATSDLLLIGFCIATLCGALSSLILSLSLDDQLKLSSIMHWLLGSFVGKSFDQLFYSLVPGILAFIVALKITPALDVLALGEDLATSLSVNLKNLNLFCVVSIALFVAAAISLGGAIPFVGLIVPHINRILIGPTQRKLLILSAINGAVMTLLADLAARSLFAPREIEVGIITSLLGAPFFLWLLLKERRASQP